MPPSPNTRIASTAAAPSPAATRADTYTQSSPQARNAELWIRGESDWAIGSPITMATFVVPDGVIAGSTFSTSPWRGTPPPPA